MRRSAAVSWDLKDGRTENLYFLRIKSQENSTLAERKERKNQKTSVGKKKTEIILQVFWNKKRFKKGTGAKRPRFY